MVDLSGGQDGPIEHGFSNSVFIVPAIIIITLSDGSTGRNGCIKKLQESLDSDGKSPLESLEQIAELLNKLELSDEEKAQLSETLSGQKDKMSAFMRPGLDILPDGNRLMMAALVIAFIVVVTLFVFFGYKLYRSLTEKERKRDEKRKQKQMKKKK